MATLCFGTTVLPESVPAESFASSERADSSVRQGLDLTSLPVIAAHVLDESTTANHGLSRILRESVVRLGLFAEEGTENPLPEMISLANEQDWQRLGFIRRCCSFSAHARTSPVRSISK